MANESERVRGAPGEQDLAIGREELLQARPGVADDRRPAGCRFEQADTRRPAALHHRIPRHVEREALSRVERRVLRRRHVDSALDIAGPPPWVWILRPGHGDPAAA